MEQRTLVIANCILCVYENPLHFDIYASYVVRNTYNEEINCRKDSPFPSRQIFVFG